MSQHRIDIGSYIVLTILLIIISFGRHGNDSFLMTEQNSKVFSKGSFLSPDVPHFEDVGYIIKCIL